MSTRHRVIRWLGRLALLALLGLAVFVINLVWFRPFSLNLFYEKVFLQFALRQPELLTSLGVAEQFGYRAHNAQLDDESIAKGDRDFAHWRQALADLKAYDPQAQNESQRLSTRVLGHFINGILEGERFRFHDYPVNQLSGVQSGTPEFLINQHLINDRRGAEDYLARLGQFGRKFDQVLQGLAVREQRGIVPPRFVVERVLTEMRDFSGKPTLQQALYTHFASKLDTLPGLSAADKQVMLERCAVLIESSVVPAYKRLINFFEAQLPRTTNDDGVWKLPDGDAFYAWRLRQQTTTQMTPQEVHELGLAEVARIEAQMRSILLAQVELKTRSVADVDKPASAAGAAGAASVNNAETPAQAMVRLSKDARFLYPNTDAGRDAARADFARMIDEQMRLSKAYIGLIPKAPIEVRRVPTFREATAPAAYYNPPALDGSRPGVFYINLRDMAELAKFGMRTLAVHEGVPGHHFQIALAQEQGGGPTFRKVLPFTAYAEGWALYTEWLALEMGLYKNDPFADLGRLRDEMLRAARLVVDTGLHHKRWTREQAIAYMSDKTGMTEPEIVSEVERYIVDPGQACAYKLGMLRMQAARERAAKALGPRFDVQALKSFHDELLRHGALPLDVLDEQVDVWIKQRSAQPGS